MADDQQNGGSDGLVLEREIAGAGANSQDPTTSTQDRGSFAQGKFTVADLKSIDVGVELTTLLEQVRQLMTICNPDGNGIWDGQRVSAVPLKGRQSANLVTQIGVGSGKAPKDQDNLLFSVEVAYFAAQIAHHLEELDLFDERLKKVYILQPDQILADWADTTESQLSLQVIEQKNHWSHVVDTLLDAAGALKTATAEQKKATENAQIAVEEGVGAGAAAEAEDDLDFIGAFGHAKTVAESEGESGDTAEPTPSEVPAPDYERVALTAPAAIMQAFMQENGPRTHEDFSRKLHGAGFSSREQQLIVDQTAWIYSGVLAQVFPDAVGRFESLDPVARAQVNQLVRDYMLQYANDPQRLSGLIANPLGRRDLILDILQKNSPALSVMAQRDQTHFETSVQLNSREETISQEVQKLQEYLLASAQAQGTPLTDQEAQIEAYNALSKLSDAELRGLSAGLVQVREKVFESAAQTSAKALLSQSLAKLTNTPLESLDIKNVSLSLDAAVLNLIGTGLSSSDVADYFTDVPASELLLLLGVEPSNPLYSTFLENVQVIRDSAQLYVEQKIITWGATREFAQVPGGKEAKNARVAAALAGKGSLRITPKVIEESGQTSAEVAAGLKPSATRGKKAFFKYQLERWGSLDIDEKLVAYVLSEDPVSENCWSENPPVELFRPASKFVEIESQVTSPEYQALVDIVRKDRKRFKKESERAKLRALYGSRSTFDSNGAFSDEEVQRAQAFEEKYNLLWDKLSPVEKQAMYLLAGYSVAQSNDLKLIPDFIDLSDMVGGPELFKLVKAIEENNYEQARQLAEAMQVATPVGDALVIENDVDRVAILYIGEPPTLIVPTPEPTYQVLPSPEEVAFSNAVGGDDETVGSVGTGRNAGFDLGRFRKANATKTKLPGVQRAKKFGKELVKKGAAAVDKGIGLALAAVPGVGMGLAKAWNSKAGKIGVGILGGLGALVGASYLQAISTPAGAFGAAGGALMGGVMTLGNPLGIAMGSYTGAMAAAHSPLGGLKYPWQSSTPGAPYAASGVSTPAAAAGTGAATAGATTETAAGAGAGGVAAGAGAGGAAGVGTATGVAAAGVAKAVLATFIMPAYALLGGGAMTMVVFFVIWGAFVAPAPTKPLPALPSADGETQSSAKYITVTKTATPNKIENNTPTDIEYVVSIAPKPGYRLEITGFTDEYSSFGETPAAIKPSEPVLTLDALQAGIWLDNSAQVPPGQVVPPLTNDKLLVKEHTDKYYQRGVSGVDAYLINKVTVKFNVKNYLNESYVELSQTYTTSAAVAIGEPKMGCWPTAGTIYSLPFTGIPTHANSDSFDIAAVMGQPVSAPFPGRACAYSGENDGYGRMIRLFVDGSIISRPGETLIFLFGHLNSFSSELSTVEASCPNAGPASIPTSGGIQVVPGSVIGYVGNTGNSTGSHLHYELYSNIRGGLMQGQYTSVLRLLLPNGTSTALYDQVPTCFAN